MLSEYQKDLEYEMYHADFLKEFKRFGLPQSQCLWYFRFPSQIIH